MTASSRGVEVASALLRGRARDCAQCARGGAILLPPRRAYSVSATALPVEPSMPPPNPIPPTVTSSDPAAHANGRSLYRIKSGIILSRPPLLTRPLTPFESAFFLYQKRLNERLCAPFRKQFYFKPDTAADLDWSIKVRERGGTPGRDIGVYKATGRNAWDDELRVGSRVAEPANLLERLVRDAETRVSEDGEPLAEEDRVPVEQPLPRRTEADEKGDSRRLDRELDRTLYLVVRGQDGMWRFPAGEMPTDENLHEAATRVLAQSAGVNMNTWVVGRVPVAHLVHEPVFRDDSTLQRRGEKTFFLKGRIMAGQADLKNNTMGLTDFRWLTREELQKELEPDYFHRIRGMMADR